MQGMELSKKYFEEFGRSMLEENFKDILPYLAVGLTGSGSECFGYDDEKSQDHDFEPGFCIIIPDESAIDTKDEFRLQREYDKLPSEFMGFAKPKMKPVGGNRKGVIRIGDFFKQRCGNPKGELSVYEWLSVPEYALAEAVNGEIFLDYKSRLLELAQTRGFQHNIRFEVTDERGPAHMKEFDVSVYSDDTLLACATGHSKKDAEQKSAEKGIKEYIRLYPDSV